jgi:type IV secretion system protein VirB9
VLERAAASGAKNANYWFCGSAQLQPIAAWDDGIQTHLRFGRDQELPVLSLSNDDGSESLLNSHVQGEEVVIHRLVRRVILRRGALQGCVVNKSYGLGTQGTDVDTTHTAEEWPQAHE